MARVVSSMAKTTRLLIPTFKTSQLRSIIIYAKESPKKAQNQKPPINPGKGPQTNKGGGAYNTVDAREDNRKAEVADAKLRSKE